MSVRGVRSEIRFRSRRTVFKKTRTSKHQVEQAKATMIELPSSHVAMLAYPSEVAEVIIKASEQNVALWSRARLMAPVADIGP